MMKREITLVITLQSDNRISIRAEGSMPYRPLMRALEDIKSKAGKAHSAQFKLGHNRMGVSLPSDTNVPFKPRRVGA